MGKTRDLFKKIRDTKGTFQTKMGSMKDRNGLDLTEAEDTKKWQQYTESESEVAQSCPTLCNPMDCSLSGSSVHGIFQARVLEWIAISFSRGSSWPRNRTRVSCITSRRFTVWAPGKKRWQEYTEELYKKDLHDPDNHDGVITQLEPDILECKVRWALGSITMNKASRGDEFQLSYFKS